MMKISMLSQEKNGDKIIVIINLSSKEQKGSISPVKGNYKEIFTNTKRSFTTNQTITLQPWQYLVFSNK